MTTIQRWSAEAIAGGYPPQGAVVASPEEFGTAETWDAWDPELVAVLAEGHCPICDGRMERERVWEPPSAGDEWLCCFPCCLYWRMLPE